MAKAFKIKGFEDYYITDDGRVYSRNQYNNPAGRIKKKKECVDSTGYITTTLRAHGKSYRFRVHRLVADAFLQRNAFSQCINHKDGNKQNNNATNLEWCTYSWNNLHAFRVLKRGPSLAKKIIMLDNGRVLAEFDSSLDAERKTGISASSIRHCISGQNKHAGGYIWKHKDETCEK